MPAATNLTMSATGPRRPREIRVGCSGWIYKAWRGHFYPTTLASDLWLRHYASVFDTVEANGTFYRLPERESFVRWREATPDGFLMAVKASRFLTHMKRLREPDEPLARLFRRAKALETRLGPILFQLPPNFRIDLVRLDAFLGAARRAARRAALPPRAEFVLEFRDPSWYVAETFQMLTGRGAAWCLHDKKGSALDGAFGGACVYVRFHGTSGEYRGSYSQKQLRRWAAILDEQRQDGRDVYAYFNNDPDAAAPENALTLRAALGGRVCFPQISTGGGQVSEPRPVP